MSHEQDIDLLEKEARALAKGLCYKVVELVRAKDRAGVPRGGSGNSYYVLQKILFDVSITVEELDQPPGGEPEPEKDPCSKCEGTGLLGGHVEYVTEDNWVKHKCSGCGGSGKAVA